MVRQAALALCAATLLSSTAMADSGRLQIPDLRGLASHASEHTEITLGPVLLGLARHLPGSDLSDEDRKLLSRIERVEIHAFEFNESHAYRVEDFRGLRAQLDAPGWTRIVQSHSTADNEDVDIAVAMDHDAPTGLAVVVTSPRELTVINIVGRISPEELSRIGGSIGIPKGAVAGLHDSTTTVD
jgi:hypothetical protein